jgi:hypothetical protein
MNSPPFKRLCGLLDFDDDARRFFASIGSQDLDSTPPSLRSTFFQPEDRRVWIAIRTPVLRPWIAQAVEEHRTAIVPDEIDQLTAF